MSSSTTNLLGDTSPENAIEEKRRPEEKEKVNATREETASTKGEDEASDDNNSSGSETEMFKRLRLRRASENDDGVERNERGLVTRVKHSFKKNRAGSAETLDAPLPEKPMFATVCINNVNRSMEAHSVLHDAGLRVCSFGAGDQVCFPARTATTPRSFGFGTPYETMYTKLCAEDEELYRRNGVLKMLQRNKQIKPKPQQFQSLLNKQLLDLDVIVCLDYSMFIVLLNDLRMRIRLSFQKKRLHVICLDVEDTPQDASSGGVLTLELCQAINALTKLNDDDVKRIVVDFEKRHQIDMFYIGLSV